MYLPLKNSFLVVWMLHSDFLHSYYYKIFNGFQTKVNENLVSKNATQHDETDRWRSDEEPWFGDEGAQFMCFGMEEKKWKLVMEKN